MSYCKVSDVRQGRARESRMSKQDRLDRVIAENPGLGYRDLRDLLMEHGATGTRAGELAAGRD
jgi:hypothetical protein